jgi:15-cis-phytoene synthase
MTDDLNTLVRQYDQDRYLATLFVPENKRPHLMALYAFNAEITRIAGQVSEPQLAEIRLQWWLDAIEGIYHQDKQDHPVAQALGKAIEVGDIPKHALINLTKAHAFDFYSDAMPSLHDLEGYLGDTQSTLIQMAAMILDRDAALECAEASGLAGVAYGMMQIFNALPRARALKQCFLPADLLALRQVNPLEIYEDNSEAGITVVLAELREKARQRLNEARKRAWTIKTSVAPAFLHVALTEPYLNLALKRGSTALTRGIDLMQLRKQWLLWKAARSETF